MFRPDPYLPLSPLSLSLQGLGWSCNGWSILKKTTDVSQYTERAVNVEGGIKREYF